MAEVIDFGNILREDLTNYSGASNLKFNEKIKSLIAAGKEIYHFGFGQSPFPVPSPFVKHLQVILRLTAYMLQLIPLNSTRRRISNSDSLLQYEIGSEIDLLMFFEDSWLEV